jgi:hypothetical protein
MLNTRQPLHAELPLVDQLRIPYRRLLEYLVPSGDGGHRLYFHLLYTGDVFYTGRVAGSLQVISVALMYAT